MNSLISNPSSLFSPLNQLSPHCQRLQNSLHDGRINQKERILLEQTLWNEVKKIRALNDNSIFQYLIGYYHTILYRIAKLPPAQNDLFQYHLLIRLGDLNRYTDRNDVAEYCYCNARNLFPDFGHAYNQLGLLTKPTNCYKCCYYYVRAARSSDKPLNTIADSNLRIAVSKYNCEILNYILNNEACINIDTECKKLPETAFEWFYVIVVAIYADNIRPIARMFLCFLYENFSTQKSTTIREGVKMTTIYCDKESYILLSGLDILLDWLKLGSQGKSILSTVSFELRQIRSCLQSIVASCTGEFAQNISNISSNATSTTTILDTNLTRASANLSGSNSILQDSTYTNATDSSKSSNNNKLPALPHDYVLRGFSPLNSIHRDLHFKPGISTKGTNEDDSLVSVSRSCHGTDNKKFIDNEQLVQVVLRLKLKLDEFGSLIRKKTRNIALESILSNMDRNNEL